MKSFHLTGAQTKQSVMKTLSAFIKKKKKIQNPPLMTFLSLKTHIWKPLSCIVLVWFLETDFPNRVLGVPVDIIQMFLVEQSETFSIWYIFQFLQYMLLFAKNNMVLLSVLCCAHVSGLNWNYILMDWWVVPVHHCSAALDRWLIMCSSEQQ